MKIFCLKRHWRLFHFHTLLLITNIPSVFCVGASLELSAHTLAHNYSEHAQIIRGVQTVSILLFQMN